MATTIDGEATTVKSSTDESQKQFGVQRIYTKNHSFTLGEVEKLESKEWKPQARLEVNNKNKKLAKDLHEMALILKLIVSMEDKTVFTIELEQAGAFTLKNLSKEEMETTLNITCLHLIYPYACEAMASMIQRAGFPPIYLAPIDFNQMYQQRQERAKKTETTARPETTKATKAEIVTH